MNLEERLPILVSWRKGFVLGRVAKITPRFMQLTLRRHPTAANGMRWAVWCHRVSGEAHPKGELVWCLELPMRSEAAARMIFAEIQAHPEYKRNSSAGGGLPETQPSLTESQLRFLAKSYPRTIALFRAVGLQANAWNGNRLGDELGRAFVEETYACSKVLLESVEDRNGLRRMARRFKRMADRKREPDPIEFELIVGCHAKNYCRMKCDELLQAVEKATGQGLTLETLKKKWKRLALPSERKRGRPKGACNR